MSGSASSRCSMEARSEAPATLRPLAGEPRGSVAEAGSGVAGARASTPARAGSEAAGRKTEGGEVTSNEEERDGASDVGLRKVQATDGGIGKGGAHSLSRMQPRNRKRDAPGPFVPSAQRAEGPWRAIGSTAQQGAACWLPECEAPARWMRSHQASKQVAPEFQLACDEHAEGLDRRSAEPAPKFKQGGEDDPEPTR